MKLYVMRHGTSIWNEQGKTQGRSNNRLSENGKKIIEKTANQLKNIKFDIMFCSPLMRAVQSANILRKKLKCKKIKDNRIIEIDQGIFTGKIYNQLTPLQIKQALTGYGRAEKNQIQQMVKTMLSLKSIPRPDDAADALAVALCHAQTNKLGGLFSI